MKTYPHLVLVHSPLVGRFTWSLVAEELARRGVPVTVPALSDAGEADDPYWQRETRAAARAVRLPAGERVALVGHSGAGPLLPLIAAELENPVSAYVFVDASLPQRDASLLDLLRSESAVLAAEFDVLLSSGGRYPDWSEADLLEIIPDETLVRKLLAQVQPRGLDFFSEPRPLPAGWPDAPCAYLQFSSSYDYYARQAEADGWPVQKWDGGHFDMLVDPPRVAEALLELIERLRRA